MRRSRNTSPWRRAKWMRRSTTCSPKIISPSSSCAKFSAMRAPARMRYAAGADKPHYLVSEIFFRVDNPDKDADALKDAQSVEAQLKTGGVFAMVAHQFSQSPSAAAGGDIGY